MSSPAIYLAYCPQNSTIIAHSIYQYLTDHDHPVFVDLESPDQYDPVIANHLIVSSPIFVPILAPGTMELCPDHLAMAIAEAVRLERIIIPVVFGGSAVREQYMREPQFIPRGTTPISMVYGNFDEGMTRLMNDIGKHQKRPELAPLPPEHTATITRKIEFAASYPTPSLSQMMEMSKVQDAYVPKPPEPEPEPTPLEKAQSQEERQLSNATRMIQNMPSNPLGYMQRGRIYEELGRLDESLADYAQALKLRPENDEYQRKVRRLRKLLDYKVEMAGIDPTTVTPSVLYAAGKLSRDELLTKANDAIERGDPRSALDLYDVLLEAYPLDELLYLAGEGRLHGGANRPYPGDATCRAASNAGEKLHERYQSSAE
jgi:hypothetical protein